MPNTRHNKYVSVTDWFATPPTSSQTGSVQQSVSRPSPLTGGGGGGNWGSTAVPPSSGGYSLEEIQYIVETYGSDFFLRKDRDDTANGIITFNDLVKSNDFAQGNLMGAGWSIYRDGNNSVVIETDRVIVRKDMTVSELIVNQETFLKGSTIYVKAGCTLTGVEDMGTYYRCYYDNKDGDEFSGFVENDLARCLRYDKSYALVVKYYWRKVVGVGDNYVDLSKIDGEYDGVGIPEEGDDIAQLGNTEDKTRQSAVVISPDSGGSIIIWAGINSFSLSEKNMVGMGVDSSSGKAYIYGYGDLYFGDRNQEQFINYSPEDGLHINGTLSIGTKFGDKTLLDVIDSATPDGYEEFVGNVTDELNDIKVNIDGVETSIIDLQKLLDGAIETWFYEGIPTLENAPAFNWTTDELKNAHLGDLYYNKTTGKAYRFQMDGTVYLWVEITDTDIQAAMQAANAAQDTADNKRRVFITTPYPPYDKGDLWSRGSDYPLMICVVPKASGNYTESDWDYADNTERVKQEMQTLVETTTSTLNNKIGQANEAISKLDDDLSDAKTDLQGALDELNNAKDDIESIYDWAKKDGEFTDIEKVALDAANAQAIASINLYDTLVKAWADGEVTEDEQIKIDGAKASLQAAKDYADQKADEAFAQIAGYEYLKKALKEDTTVEGGLIQTSLLKLGYTNTQGQRVTMSGTNGVYNSNAIGGGVASWWGGDIYDLLDYYTWDGNKWNPKSNVTIPTNIPSGLVRFDGTGYFAKGNLWWEEDGTLHADPSALFLSFDVEAQEGTLAATILNIESTIAKFSDMWEIKKDGNGNEYLFAKRSVVTQGGLTQYSDTSGLIVDGIYDAIPIDGSTIYWEYDSNGKKSVLKAKVAEGGITSITKDMVVDALGYTPYDATNPNGYITSAALNDYLPLSGGTIDGNLNIGNTDNTGYKSIRIYRNNQVLEIANTLVYAVLSYGNVSFTFNSNGAYWNNNTLIHSGNYTDYTYSKSQVDSALSSYLPLSGGTVTISHASGLIIRRTDSNYPCIAFYNNNTGTQNYIGFDPSANPVWFDYSGTTRNFIHSGNIGSQSVNYASSAGNADTLDGLHWGSFMRQFGYITSANTGNALLAGTFRFQEISGTGLPSGATAYGTMLTARGGDYDTLWQLYGNYNNDGLFYRRGNLTGIVSNAWKQIAFIDSNVASATKLQTARTIWGQSFDGSGNVSGTLTLDNLTALYFTSIGSGTYNKTVIQHNADGLLIDLARTTESTSGTIIPFLIQARGGTEIFRIDSSGNVGIGTTSPAYTLHVNGDIKFLNKLVWIDTTNYYIGARSNNAFDYVNWYGHYFKSAGTDRMCITREGLVGIGTISPAHILDVKGNIGCSNVYHSDGVIYLTMGASGTTRYVNVGQYNNSTYSTYLNLNASLATRWISAAGSEIVRIDHSNGKVGIGTTSPAYKLDIQNNTDTAYDFHVYNSSNKSCLFVGKDAFLYGTSKTNATPILNIIAGTTYDGGGGGSCLAVLGNGNVGIGITNPTNKLTIYGNSRCTYMEFWNTSLNGYAGYIGRGSSGNNHLYLYSYNNLYFGTGGTADNMSLDSSANLLVKGGITQYSDIRKKTKLQDVELTLKQVANAPLIEHYYNSDDKKTTHVGSIAQYWAEMNDWFCKLDNDGYYTMEIQNAALASAISIARELERYESKTDKKIRMLKKRINELEDEIEKLKNVA